jgi:hypothetical protein
MSVIEFLCPNGHQIRCQAEQAGRAAKCPRCEVRFRVPDPSELESGTSDALSKQDFADFDFSEEKPSVPEPAPKETAPKKNQQMEFLCPNGHRLFGSPGLAGRPGECPDCGARFRIPNYEEISLDETPSQDARFNHSSGQAVVPQEPAPVAPLVPPPASPAAQRRPPATSSQTRPQSAWEDEVMPATIWAIAAGTALVEQPVATLFARLWTTKPKGARIEIQMRDGEAVVVEQFMAALSQQSHGVFCLRSADNTFTLMAVAWDTIARVLVRGLSEMPKT